jgi:hypothetical protein
MMIVALIILGLAGAGVALGLFAVTSAPVGFQDEKGFHFGPDKVATKTQESFGFEVSHAKAA